MQHHVLKIPTAAPDYSEVMLSAGGGTAALHYSEGTRCLKMPQHHRITYWMHFLEMGCIALHYLLRHNSKFGSSTIYSSL